MITKKWLELFPTVTYEKSIIKSFLVLKASFYLSTATIILFLSRYVVSIVKFSFPPLLIQFYLFLHLLPFVSSFQWLYVSFSVIMKGSLNKEKVEKMLRGQSSRKAKLNSKPNVILEKGNR
jgi:hypothetical protein